MKRILTFLVILIVLVIIGIIAIAFTITPALTNPTGLVVVEIEENESKVPNFRLYTRAVCKNTSGLIVCNDELFANCGGYEYVLPKNDVNGSGVFSKDWQDPRND